MKNTSLKSKGNNLSTVLNTSLFSVYSQQKNLVITLRISFEVLNHAPNAKVKGNYNATHRMASDMKKQPCEHWCILSGDEYRQGP